MDQQNNSDKTKFKVKFLGEYHDMVIDWNDDKYEYKEQQVFEQLASLTGIPAKYLALFFLVEDRPVDPIFLINGQRLSRGLPFRNITHLPPGSNPIDSTFVKDNIHDVFIQNGQRFHLRFDLFYDSSPIKRIVIDYDLIPETEVQEGVCSHSFCQHKNTKSYFNKVKDLVCNDELNLQISQRVQPIMEREYDDDSWAFEKAKVFREFNVQQFFQNQCNLQFRHSVGRGYSRQIPLYLRMRG